MRKILRKEKLTEVTKLMVIDAPEVARKAKAGQFVVIRIHEQGERIPLTVADFDRDAGTVTIVIQEVGKTTKHLGTLEAGDELATFTGPLGRPSEIERYGTVICVGGGVGIAPVFPIARALKEAGNTVLSVIGARTEDLLIWEEEMRSVSDELVVCTDDGSYGMEARVTEPLQTLLEERQGEIDRVWAIGPAAMMKFVAATTKPFGVPTIVSLNTVMIDGTGMCGGCRVNMEDGAKFACVDGPEFDAHKVDWYLLLARQRAYLEEEAEALERWEHRCRLEGS
ncbi:MAG: sulfide/dihydroorotate dehydrogenase-like FAD/NAD-binding protein [Anaerolineales bacterium]|nr:MAG: sulfide/dihydroorotate dehydrogenase-like FAD/NAD-binding protein [Anaerolineales bacterium]